MTTKKAHTFKQWLKDKRRPIAMDLAGLSDQKKRRVVADNVEQYRALVAADKAAAMTDAEIRETAVYTVRQFGSERDLLVFNLNADGLGVRAIGRRLHVSVGTVSASLRRIESMGVRVLRHKGGAGAHAGDAYRQNGELRDRTHTGQLNT